VTMNLKSILIVDDDLDIRETLRDAFEHQGYAVAVAGNGKEALDLLACPPRPSAVILDLIMPVMSGQELYAAMQADPTLSRIPIVVSTSDASRAPSGVLIMRKPIDLVRLLATVQSLV
jgi:CheY-like chemotaxis protein